MARLIIYKAPFEELRKTGAIPVFPDGSSSDILRQTLDYSEKDAPVLGTRLTEYRNNVFTPQPFAPSLYRDSPWVVVREDNYALDDDAFSLEDGQFDRVVIATCAYQPLPDEDNPWKPSLVADVGLDSFDGDAKAFNAYQEAH